MTTKANKLEFTKVAHVKAFCLWKKKICCHLKYFKLQSIMRVATDTVFVFPVHGCFQVWLNSHRIPRNYPTQSCSSKHGDDSKHHNTHCYKSHGWHLNTKNSASQLQNWCVTGPGSCRFNQLEQRVSVVIKQKKQIYVFDSLEQLVLRAKVSCNRRWNFVNSEAAAAYIL